MFCSVRHMHMRVHSDLLGLVDYIWHDIHVLWSEDACKRNVLRWQQYNKQQEKYGKVHE